MKAELNYLRIAPRKIRLVAEIIRKKPVNEARTILKFSRKKGAKHLAKLLDSAVANARHNFSKTGDNLYVAKITVNEGPVYKRYMPRARGVPSLIRKKTSHIALVLKEQEKSEARNPKS